MRADGTFTSAASAMAGIRALSSRTRPVAVTSTSPTPVAVVPVFGAMWVKATGSTSNSRRPNRPTSANSGVAASLPSGDTWYSTPAPASTSPAASVLEVSVSSSCASVRWAVPNATTAAKATAAHLAGFMSPLFARAAEADL